MTGMGQEMKDGRGWHATGRFKGIISYICAFPEVITELTGLEGKPFLSSERTGRRQRVCTGKPVMTAREREQLL